VRRGEIKERIDPKFIAYGGHQEIQVENKKSLGELVIQETVHPTFLISIGEKK